MSPPPVAKQRNSVSSVASAESFGAKPRTPSPTKPIAPLPEIQITRTESNRSTVDEKWIKPRELEEDDGNKSSNFSFFNSKSKK